MGISLIYFHHAQPLDLGDGVARRVVSTDDLDAVMGELSHEDATVIVIGANASTSDVNAIRTGVLGKRACFVLVNANDTPAGLVRLVRHGIRRLGPGQI